MTEYRISQTGTLRSLKYLRRDLYVFPIGLTLLVSYLHYVNNVSWNSAFEFALPLALAAFFIFEVLPTLIMHIIHYVTSREVRIIFDDFSDRVTFIGHNEEYRYSFEELEVTQVLAIYQKNKIDGGNRRAMACSNYSYLRFRTRDFMEFNISSLIVSAAEIPIEVKDTMYDFWPSFATWKRNYQQEIDEGEQQRQQQLGSWKNQFSSLSSDQIVKKLEHSEQLAELPRIALEELLEERK